MVFFLEAISGYYPILIELKDAEKITFITDERVFCYKVMPFGLKIARATYQRLVSGIFKDLIGTLVKVYIDDMEVKICALEDYLNDIRRVIDILDKTCMKKYTFGINVRKFSGYIVS